MRADRLRIPDAAWLTLVAIAIVGLSAQAFNLLRLSPDGVAAQYSLYRDLAPELPSGDRVAFVRTSAGDAGTQEYFIAQHALSPRILDEDLSAAPVAITGLGAGAAMDDRLARAGFELVAERPGRIRIYRRLQAK